MPDNTRSRTRSRSDSGSGSMSSPTLILAMDYGRPLALAQRFPLGGALEITIGRARNREVRNVLGGGQVGLRLDIDDEWMSSQHACLRCRAGQWTATDLGSRNGVFVNGERCVGKGALRVNDGDVLEIGNTLFVFRAASPNVSAADDGSTTPPLGLDTMNDAVREVQHVLARVASADLPIILEGETGTGKEVVARALHAHSGRSGDFVAVNCGALPKDLVESELFGYRKGAFSGANEDRIGLVRAAHGGTLFLDEIAELAEASQVALLRVLQEAEVTPLGATAPIKVDVRVVVASHQNLEAAIAKGRFREDLYGRIAGLVCKLPPLRERKEDIGVLVSMFLRRHGGERGPESRLHRLAARALFAYDWPRNIRELEAAVRAGIALAQSEQIKLADLPGPLRDAVNVEAERPLGQSEEIVEALRAERGNVSAAARKMGMSRAHFHRLMKKHEIDPADHRD